MNIGLKAKKYQSKIKALIGSWENTAIYATFFFFIDSKHDESLFSYKK